MTPAELQEVVRLHGLWLTKTPNHGGARAVLHGADLSQANLSHADLRWAELEDSNLSEAHLQYADLRYANLTGARLWGARLHGARLHGADLQATNLDGAFLSGALGLPIVADAPARLQAVAAQVLSDPSCLTMETWHSDCGTTHSLAGWAIHQAGPIGALLEAVSGFRPAGLFLLGHDADDRFYQSNEEVLEWLRSISEVQP